MTLDRLWAGWRTTYIDSVATQMAPDGDHECLFERLARGLFVDLPANLAERVGEIAHMEAQRTRLAAALKKRLKREVRLHCDVDAGLIGGAVVRAGDFLNPSRVGAVAAVGCAELEVFGQPRVAILSTGNEVIEPGRPLASGQIYDVNRFTLTAVAAAHGGIAVPQRPAADTLEALTDALEACAGADVIIFSGGSSVGERDLTVDLVAGRGELHEFDALLNPFLDNGG